jgi:hypothetical protein
MTNLSEELNHVAEILEKRKKFAPEGIKIASTTTIRDEGRNRVGQRLHELAMALEANAVKTAKIHSMRGEAVVKQAQLRSLKQERAKLLLEREELMSKTTKKAQQRLRPEAPLEPMGGDSSGEFTDESMSPNVDGGAPGTFADVDEPEFDNGDAPEFGEASDVPDFGDEGEDVGGVGDEIGGDEGVDEEDEESDDSLDAQISDALHMILENNPDISAEELIDTLTRKVEDDSLSDELGAESAEEEDEEVGEEEPEEGESEEHEESETEDEEREEHENGEEPKEPKDDVDGSKSKSTPDAAVGGVGSEELMLHERKACVKGDIEARFYPHKERSKASWVVKVAGATRLRVRAGKAFPELDRRPAPGELGVKQNYPTYYHAFASEQYGQSLLEAVSKVGVVKTASLCAGTLVKQSQVGGIMPQTSTAYDPTAEQNPKPNTSAPPTTSVPKGEPEGVGDPNMNPSKDAEDSGWNMEDPKKMLVSDIILSIMAPFAANGDYSVDEIVDECKAVFGDDEAVEEFKGALAQMAENMTDETKDVAPDTDGANNSNVLPTGAMGTLPKSTTPAVGAAGEVGNPAPPAPTSSMPVLAALEKKIAQLEKENADYKGQVEKLARERTLRFRFQAAREFVENEMVPRGLVPSVRQIMQDNPLIPKEAAMQQVKEIIIEKAKNLVRMEPKSLEIHMSTIRDLPIGRQYQASANTDAEDAELRFAASRDANNLPIYHQERDEKVGLEAVFTADNSWGGKKLTELARRENEKRRKR